MNYEYYNFEDWFDELEGFSFRSGRFLGGLPKEMRDKKTLEYLELWLRAAFDSARLENNENVPS